MAIGNRVCFEVPAGVPAPKFQMFQKVSFEGDRGVIVGLEYVCPISAIAEDLSTGWRYSISYAFGVNLTEVATWPKRRQMIEPFIWEESIEPWSESFVEQEPERELIAA